MKIGWLHDGKNQTKWNWLAGHQKSTVGYHWYLTDAPAPPQGGTGIHTSLTNNYRNAIADAARILTQNGVTVHFTDVVPNITSRNRAPNMLPTPWTQNALNAFTGCDAVLLDPDIGIATSATPKSAHALAGEIVAFSAQIPEVAIFQHTDRRGPATQQSAIARCLGPLLPPHRTITFGRVSDQSYLVFIK
jgi:hypothetical protein